MTDDKTGSADHSDRVTRVLKAMVAPAWCIGISVSVLIFTSAILSIHNTQVAFSQLELARTQFEETSAGYDRLLEEVSQDAGALPREAGEPEQGEDR